MDNSGRSIWVSFLVDRRNGLMVMPRLQIDLLVNLAKAGTKALFYFRCL